MHERAGATGHRVWFERAVLPELFDEMASRCTMLGPGDATPDDMYHDLAAADGIVAGANDYTAGVMDLAPDLKVIARTGIGVDRVDIAAATARGIAVCNAPDGPTISTAEHTVALMLAVTKRLEQSEHRLAAGEENLYARHDAIELNDKVLGLVGFGRIAQRVAAAAAALGMRIHAYDPYVEDGGETHLVSSLEELLETSDVVSVHVPLTEETQGMFDTGAFSAMKQGAIFVNTARGGLVDQAALLEALESGKLFGAGLDVTDPEPLQPGHPLLGRMDAVVTPHVATGTREARRRLLVMAFDLVIDVLEGRRPASLVNPEVWK